MANIQNIVSNHFILLVSSKYQGVPSLPASSAIIKIIVHHRRAEGLFTYQIALFVPPTPPYTLLLAIQRIKKSSALNMKACCQRLSWHTFKKHH